METVRQAGRPQSDRRPLVVRDAARQVLAGGGGGVCHGDPGDTTVLASRSLTLRLQQTQHNKPCVGVMWGQRRRQWANI